uniref:NADH-ubiquinone oxidoreductase chain 2 n=1 Tax=Carcinochelis bannaensis TaxID=2126074 RepID=A0A343W8N7_9HEMI|nr:NADH dehydrogenase subunit 2 [Carcinochelis bannaensis]AVZ00727.1 NADH dehydrogenase subunit 2 [Carcinochelis bannaensis]
MNSSKAMFYIMMVMSTLMIISSDNLLGMWMGLEINMMSFIPILSKDKSILASESCMIYFLVQSMGSILMIMMILVNSLINVTPSLINELITIIIVMSMMIKLGAPPFHFWFPNILEKMGWSESFILMTWQKMGPLMITSSIIKDQYIMIPLVILSVTVGAIGGLNQTSVKKIMAYSSISHLGWMIMCMKFNNQLWLTYLTIYSMIILMMILMFKNYSSNYINQVNIENPSLTEKMMISSSFLSLGGLPPFIGFLPKWMVIQNMIMSDSFSTLLVMILSTLITLFFYTRIMSSSFLISFASTKWMLNKKTNSFSLKILITNMILPIMMIISY